MGIFSKFERKMEDTVEGAADKMVNAPISPVQIAKKAEKQMRREKMVGAGKQYAPTLYTVLVNAEDDERLFGYYPTLAGETETYLSAKAAEGGLVMDGQPLVRFIVDDELKHGKFEIIAEMVAAPLVAQLRQEEMERYGLATPRNARGVSYQPAGARSARPAYPAQPQAQAQPAYETYDDPEEYGDQSGFDTYGDYYGEDAGYNAYDNSAAELGAAAGAGVAMGAAGAAGMAGAASAAAAGQPQTMVFDPAGANQPAPDVDPLTPMPQQLTAYLYDITNDRAFTLNRDRMRIGRESNNHVVIPDINASRQHAEIRQEPNGIWVLSDLGSTNGTFVNGRRIKSAPMHDGDMLVIGTTDIEFQLI